MLSAERAERVGHISLGIAAETEVAAHDHGDRLARVEQDVDAEVSGASIASHLSNGTTRTMSAPRAGRNAILSSTSSQLRGCPVGTTTRSGSRSNVMTPEARLTRVRSAMVSANERLVTEVHAVEDADA